MANSLGQMVLREAQPTNTLPYKYFICIAGYQKFYNKYINAIDIANQQPKYLFWFCAWKFIHILTRRNSILP